MTLVYTLEGGKKEIHILALNERVLFTKVATKDSIK
jgi:hypothetical protein